MANKEGNRTKLQNQEAATTYLLFCSGHVYSLLVNRWALTTASWQGRVPVLSSSSSSGPRGNLAGTLATRGTQHRGATFLPTLHWFSDRSPAQVWKGKQRQAADHSGEGCPGGRSDGYVLPRGQWSTGLAGGCPGGRGRNSAFWRLDCEAAEMVLCFLLFLKDLETNPIHLGKWSITWKSPSPHNFLIEAFWNIL